MADEGTAHGAGKHEQARRLAEQAVRAEARGDTDRARDLFAAATRTDATAVADVLQQEDAVHGRLPRSSGEPDPSAQEGGGITGSSGGQRAGRR